MLTFNVQPAAVKQGKLGLLFLPENGERNGCELQVALGDQRAKFASASLNYFAGREK